MLSVPFNPFTLEYDKSPEGHNLYQRDLEVEHRALQRSHLLDTKGNGQFDILTGNQLCIHIYIYIYIYRGNQKNC